MADNYRRNEASRLRELELRLRSGRREMTLTEVAKEFGVSRETIRMWEESALAKIRRKLAHAGIKKISDL